MKIKLNKKITASAVCGIFAILLSALYLNSKEQEIYNGGKLEKILVARVDIKSNTLLEPGLVEVKKIPRLFVQPGALRSNRDINGLVVITDIKSGEQILKNKLVVGGSKSGLSFKVPKDKRAVSISLTDDKSSGGLIRPDDYVDVIATFDYGDSGRLDKYTYKLFQNVEVLAVGSKTTSLRNPDGIVRIQDKSKDKFGSISNISSQNNKNIITIALCSEDLQKFIFAKESGSVELVLRSPMDRIVTETSSPITIDHVTGRSGYLRKDYKEYKGKK